jgi:GTPase SAR1 family protein
MAANTFNTLKICVLGPSAVGKSLLCRALAEQPLPGEYSPTVAVR